MPFIQAKLTGRIDRGKEEVLQAKLTEAAASTLGKPKSYVMVGIEEGCMLWMADKRLGKGAFVSVRLLGTPTRDACAALARQITDILVKECGVDGKSVYVSFHPVENWALDGNLL